MFQKSVFLKAFSFQKKMLPLLYKHIIGGNILSGKENYKIFLRIQRR